MRKLEAAVRQVRCIGLLGGCGGSGESKKQMTTPYCGYCGRPVIGHAVYCGGLAYHPECTRGPGAQQYAPMPAMPGCTPVTPLTAEDVRRIVREELANDEAHRKDAVGGLSGGADCSAAMLEKGKK